jgi:hypothetical protein
MAELISLRSLWFQILRFPLGKLLPVVVNAYREAPLARKYRSAALVAAHTDFRQATDQSHLLSGISLLKVIEQSSFVRRANAAVDVTPHGSSFNA